MIWQPGVISRPGKIGKYWWEKIRLIVPVFITT